jgi:hypothetical protein
MNNFRNLLLALHNSAETGTSDPSVAKSFPSGCYGPGATPEDRLSWLVVLLPYLEEDSIFRQVDLEKGYEGNIPTVDRRIRTFVCPASELAPEAALTHYVAMSGLGLDAATRPAGAPGNGFMGYDRKTSLTMIKDGLSNTIALMETRSNLGPWARGGPSTVRGFDPADRPLWGDQRPFGGHTGAIHTGMADGSVRSIHASIDPANVGAAITIDGGEPVDLD